MRGFSSIKTSVILSVLQLDEGNGESSEMTAITVALRFIIEKVSRSDVKIYRSIVNRSERRRRALVKQPVDLVGCYIRANCTAITSRVLSL